MTGFESKRQAAQAKLDDDDAQVYIEEYEAALLVSYQSGFADGKRSVQRKPLTEEMRKQMLEVSDNYERRGAFANGWLSAEAAHNIKEQP